MIPGIQHRSKSDPCVLCQSTKGLEHSHLIPRFVFKHASVRSPTGYLRTTLNPNVRQQDGPKEYLLCRECEARFSTWESKFAPRFHAHNQEPGRSFDYSSNESLCALSILWRVLAHARLHPELKHLVFGSDYTRTDEAFETWRKVLLGEQDNPGKFRIFWLYFDYVKNAKGLGNGTNRYIFHSTDFDVVANSELSFAYAHLPGIFLVGALEGIDRSRFRGFDVSFRGGRYNARENKVAPSFLLDVIREKIAIKENASNLISPRQKEKIRSTALANSDKFESSLLHRTYRHDLGLD